MAADAGGEWWTAWDEPVDEGWTLTFDDSSMAADWFDGSTGADPWDDGAWWGSDNGFDAVDASSIDPAEVDWPAAADPIIVVPPSPTDQQPTSVVESPEKDAAVEQPTEPTEEAVAPLLDESVASDETAAATVVPPMAPVGEVEDTPTDDVASVPSDVPLAVRDDVLVDDVLVDDVTAIPGDVVVDEVSDVPGDDLADISGDGVTDVPGDVVVDDASRSDDPQPSSVPISLDGGAIPPVVMAVTAPGIAIPPSASGSVFNRFAAWGAFFFPGFGGSVSATDGAAAGGQLDGQPGSGRPRLRLPIRPLA